jgi:hypothetical protein
VSKTPAQLDREIAAALKRRDAPGATGDYYYVTDRGAHRTIYGPYETQKDAAYAAYFHKPVADRDATPAHIFFGRGVQQYDDEEIRSIVRNPQEYVPGLKSAKLVRRAPPMHASWKKLGDNEFRQHLRDKDYDLAGLLSRRTTPGTY